MSVRHDKSINGIALVFTNPPKASFLLMYSMSITRFAQGCSISSDALCLSRFTQRGSTSVDALCLSRFTQGGSTSFVELCLDSVVDPFTLFLFSHLLKFDMIAR